MSFFAVNGGAEGRRAQVGDRRGEMVRGGGERSKVPSSAYEREGRGRRRNPQNSSAHEERVSGGRGSGAHPFSSQGGSNVSVSSREDSRYLGREEDGRRPSLSSLTSIPPPHTSNRGRGGGGPGRGPHRSHHHFAAACTQVHPPASHAENQPGCLPPPLIASSFPPSASFDRSTSAARSEGQQPSQVHPTSAQASRLPPPGTNGVPNSSFTQHATGLPASSHPPLNGPDDRAGDTRAPHDDEARSGGVSLLLTAAAQPPLPGGSFGFHPGPLPTPLYGPPLPCPPPPGSAGCPRPPTMGGGGEGSRGGPNSGRERLADNSMIPQHSNRPHPPHHGLNAGGPFGGRGEADGNRVFGGSAAAMGPGGGMQSRGLGGGAGPGGRGGNFEDGLMGGGGGPPLRGGPPEDRRMGRQEGLFASERGVTEGNHAEGGPMPASQGRKMRGPPMNSQGEGGGRGPLGTDSPAPHSNFEHPRGGGPPSLPGDAQLMGPPLHPSFHLPGSGRGDGPVRVLGGGPNAAPFMLGHHPHPGGMLVMPPGAAAAPLQGPPQQLGGPSAGLHAGGAPGAAPGAGPPPLGPGPPTAAGGDPMLGCGPNVPMQSHMMMPQGGPPPPGGPMPSPGLGVHPGGLGMAGPQPPVVGVPGPVVCGVGPLGGPAGAGGGMGPGLGMPHQQGPPPPGAPGVGNQGLRGPPANPPGPLLGVGMGRPLVGVGPHVVVGGPGTMPPSSTGVVNPPPPRRRNVLDIRDPRTGKLVIGGSLLEGGGGFLGADKKDPNAEGGANTKPEGDASKPQTEEARENAAKVEGERRGWRVQARQGEGDKPAGTCCAAKDTPALNTSGGEGSAGDVPARSAGDAASSQPAASNKKGGDAAPSLSPRMEGDSRPHGGEKRDAKEKKHREEEKGKTSAESAEQAGVVRGAERTASVAARAAAEAAHDAAAAGRRQGKEERLHAGAGGGSGHPEEGTKGGHGRSPSGDSGKDDGSKTGFSNKKDRKKNHTAGASPVGSSAQAPHSSPPTSRGRGAASSTPKAGGDGAGDRASAVPASNAEDFSSSPNGVRKQPAPASAPGPAGVTVGSVVLAPAPKRTLGHEKSEQFTASASVPPETSASVCNDERQETSGGSYGGGETPREGPGASHHPKGRGGRRGSFTFFTLHEDENCGANRHPAQTKRGVSNVPPRPPGGLPSSRHGSGAPHPRGPQASFVSAESDLVSGSSSSAPPSQAVTQPSDASVSAGQAMSSHFEGIPGNSPLHSGNGGLSPVFGSPAGRYGGAKGLGEERGGMKKGSPSSSRDGRAGKEPTATLHATNPQKGPNGKADRGSATPGSAQYSHGRTAASPAGSAADGERCRGGSSPTGPFPKGGKGFSASLVPPAATGPLTHSLSPTASSGEKNCPASSRDASDEAGNFRHSREALADRGDRNTNVRQVSQKNGGEGRQTRGSYTEKGDQQVKGGGDRGNNRSGNARERGNERGGNAVLPGTAGTGSPQKNATGRGWRPAGRGYGRDTSPSSSSSLGEVHTPPSNATPTNNSPLPPAPPATAPGPRGVWGPNGRAAGGALMRPHGHGGRGAGVGTPAAQLAKTTQPEKPVYPGPHVPASPSGSNTQESNPKTPAGVVGETGATGNEGGFTGNEGRDEGGAAGGSNPRPPPPPHGASSRGCVPGEADGEEGALTRGSGREEAREGPARERGKDNLGPAGGLGRNASRQRGNTPPHHHYKNNGAGSQGPAHAAGGRGGQDGGRGRGDRQLPGGPGKMGGNNSANAGDRNMPFPSSHEGKMPALSSPSLGARGGPPSLVPGVPGVPCPGERGEGLPPVCSPHPPSGPLPPHLVSNYEGQPGFLPRPHLHPQSSSPASGRDVVGGSAFGAGPPATAGQTAPLIPTGEGGSSPPPFPSASSSFTPYNTCAPSAHHPLPHPPPAGVATPSSCGPQQDPQSPLPFNASFPPAYPPAGSAPPQALGGPPLAEGSHPGMRMYPHPHQGRFPQQTGTEGGVEGSDAEVTGGGNNEFAAGDGCSGAQKTGSARGACGNPAEGSAGGGANSSQGFAGRGGGDAGQYSSTFNPSGSSNYPGTGSAPAGNSGASNMGPTPSGDLSESVSSVPAPSASAPYYFYPPAAGGSLPLEGSPPGEPVPLGMPPPHAHLSGGPQLPYMGPQPNPQPINCSAVNDNGNGANYAGAERDCNQGPTGEIRGGRGDRSFPRNRGQLGPNVVKNAETGAVMVGGDGSAHPLCHSHPQNEYPVARSGARMPFGYPSAGTSNSNNGGAETVAGGGDSQSGAGMYGQTAAMGVQHSAGPPSDFALSSANTGNVNLPPNHAALHPHFPYPPSSAPPFPPRAMTGGAGGVPLQGAAPVLAPGPHNAVGQSSLASPVSMAAQGFGLGGAAPPGGALQPQAPVGLSPHLGGEVPHGAYPGRSGPAPGQGPPPPQQGGRGGLAAHQRKFQGTQGGAQQAAFSPAGDRRRGSRRIENQPLKRREGDNSFSRPSSSNERAGAAAAGGGPSHGGFMGRNQGGQGLPPPSSVFTPSPAPPLCGGGPMETGPVGGDMYGQQGMNAVGGPNSFLQGGLPGCPQTPLYSSASPFIPISFGGPLSAPGLPGTPGGSMMLLAGASPAMGGAGAGSASPTGVGAGPGAQMAPHRGLIPGADPMYHSVGGGPQHGVGGPAVAQNPLVPQMPCESLDSSAVSHAGSPQRRLRKKVANVSLADARKRRGSISSWTESSRVESEADPTEALLPATAAAPMAPGGVSLPHFGGNNAMLKAPLLGSACPPGAPVVPDECASGQAVAPPPGDSCPLTPQPMDTAPPLLSTPGEAPKEMRREDDRTARPCDRRESPRAASRDQGSSLLGSPDSAVPTAAPYSVETPSAEEKLEDSRKKDEPTEKREEDAGSAVGERDAEVAESADRAGGVPAVPSPRAGESPVEGTPTGLEETEQSEALSVAKPNGSGGVSFPSPRLPASPSCSYGEQTLKASENVPRAPDEDRRESAEEQCKGELSEEPEEGEKIGEQPAEERIGNACLEPLQPQPPTEGHGGAPLGEQSDSKGSEEDRTTDVLRVPEEPTSPTRVSLPEVEESKAEEEEKKALELPLVPAEEGAAAQHPSQVANTSEDGESPLSSQQEPKEMGESPDAASQPPSPPTEDTPTARPPFFERARGSSAGLVGAPPAVFSPSMAQRESSSSRGPRSGTEVSPSLAQPPKSSSPSTASLAPRIYDKRLLVGFFLSLHGSFSPPEVLGRIRCVDPSEAQGGGSKRAAASSSKDWPFSKNHKQGGGAGGAGKSKMGGGGNAGAGERVPNAVGGGNAHLLASSGNASLFGKGGQQAGKGALAGRGGARGAAGGDWPQAGGGDNFDRGPGAGVLERSGSISSQSGGWRDASGASKWREENAALSRQNSLQSGSIFGAGGGAFGGGGNRSGHNHGGAMGADSFSRLGGFFSSSRPPPSGGNMQHGSSPAGLSRGPEFLLKKQTLDRPQRVRRAINSLLNKISIDKFAVVTEKIAIEGESLENAEELQMLADLVYAKAVTEPEYSEMYADLCQVLKWRSLEFEKADEEKNLNFNRAFVNRCQEEFEALQGKSALEVTEEERAQCHSEDDVQKLLKKKKNRVLGNMRFIGELYLRKCIAPSVLKAVVTSLVFGDSGDPNVYPDEHFIECLTELLTTIGFTLEKQPHTQQMLLEFMGKLQDLQQKANYSKRIVYKIQDLLDLKSRSWTKKVFKEKAKSVAQIREDAIRDELMGGSIHAVQQGTFTVVGMRHQQHYGFYLHEQRTIFEKKKAAKKAAEASASSSSSSSSSAAPASATGSSHSLTSAASDPAVLYGSTPSSSDTLMATPLAGKPGPPSPYNLRSQGLAGSSSSFGAASAAPPLMSTQAGPSGSGALGPNPGGPFVGAGACLPSPHNKGGNGGTNAPPLLGGAPSAFHPRFGPGGGPGAPGKGIVGPRGTPAGSGPGLMNTPGSGPEPAEPTTPPEPCEPPELKKDVEMLCFEFVREGKPFADFWQEWKALKMPSSAGREQFHALCAKAADDSHPERSARYADLLGHILCEQVRMSASLRQFIDVINVNFLPQLEDLALDNPRALSLFAGILATTITSPNFTKRQEGCMPFLEIPAAEDVAWDFLRAVYDEVKKLVSGENEMKLAFVKSLAENSMRRKFPQQPDMVVEKLASLE
ncbi:MIF4G domain-containing protein [Besnoitia besnoiti]|uniref:MIF4G domain-containing protein n=1 Tax=Besnoitia besnoiti TaxID=94643 RepID=A0A2A9M5V9_BESBE|nr:MIF4G domain-containing protein [Besnoitia besnoiti]PFH32584.1 MIF4G domain-containing protein [Besnoitia besnoiti]